MPASPAPVSPASAVRAWINSRKDLTGRGRPLPAGAYTAQQRSPAHGAYVVLIAEMGGDPDMVAEPGGPVLARVTCHVYAGTYEASEAACSALAAAITSAARVPAGASGVVILGTGNQAAPGYVPSPGGGGEQHEFQCSADFVLYQP